MAEHHALGEVSIKLAESLGGKNVDPRTAAAAPRGPFAYVIFLGSKMSPPWPIAPADLQQRAQNELARIEGWEAVLACLGK